MRVREVMTSPAVAVRPRMPARSAAALLRERGFTAAPVVDAEGRLVGVLTEADLVRERVPPDTAPGPDVAARPEPAVAEVMGTAPLVADPGADLADVVTRMLHEGVRSVPVVDSGRVVGVLTTRDVLQCVASGELVSEQVWRRRAVTSRGDAWDG